MQGTGGLKEFVRVELTPAAKRLVDQMCDQQGMKQVALLSRLVGWFARQPDDLQWIMLGHCPPELEADVARLLLKRLGS